MRKFFDQFSPNLFKFTDQNMANTIAASYTWAAAILVGMSMIQANGLIPYLVWFFSNGAAILVFGAVTKRWPGLYDVARLPLFRVIIVIVTTFTIWFNMTGLLYVSTGLQIVSMNWGIVVAIAAALFTWAYITFPKIMRGKVGGIHISVVTDRLQWMLVLGGVIVAVIITLASKAQMISFQLFTHPLNSISAYYSAFWACPLLLTALFTDGMFWHRQPYIKTMRPYKRAYGMFMIYLALAAVLALFKIPDIARWVIYICIFFAAMSTIDSCFAAYWHQISKKGGIIAGLVCVGLWIFVSRTPLLDLWWTLFSWFPLFFVIMIVAYKLMQAGKIKRPAPAILRAADALPDLGERVPFSEKLKLME
jgi:hypothetical protein